MRALLLLTASILAAGCAGTGVATHVQPSPASTVAAYQLGFPVMNKAEAVIAAEKGLEDPLFKWTEPPTALFVEEMSYAEANALIGLGEPDEAQYQLWPRETRVWFVIFEGRWTLRPMGPQDAPPNAFEGCLLTVFASRDGTRIAAGDSACPQ